MYYLSRGIIGFTRSVPDLVRALLFVTAVGLGPFPGGLALAVHSISMLGRLFAEMVENMDMAPIDALSLTGASRLQVFNHGVVPSVLPALTGIGFQLLTAMNLFQHQQVSLLLIIIFVLVFAGERLSALCRERLA